MNNITTNIIEAGFDCLIERLGIIGAETFIVEIGRNSFDYTKWQREFFDKMKPGEFSEDAVAYAKAHPHEGNGKRF